MIQKWRTQIIVSLLLMCIAFVIFQTKSFDYTTMPMQSPGFVKVSAVHHQMPMQSPGLVKVSDIDLCYGRYTNATGLKVLSYSVFGRNSLKNYGWMIKKVAQEATSSLFYKDWRVRVYHEGDVTAEFAADVLKINPLTEFCNVHDVDIVLHKDLSNKNGMTWRFMPLGDASVDMFCSRDLDSPIYQREEVAVNDWIKSGKILHVMRDHTGHQAKIMGGLWCFRNKKNRTLGEVVMNLAVGKAQCRNSKSKIESQKGDDQNVLDNFVWPLLVNDSMRHDAFGCLRFPGSIPYPTQRNKTFTFIGCKRPCKGTRDDMPRKCPIECRPAAHKDWEFC